MAFTPTIKQIDQVKVQTTPYQAITEIMAPWEEFKPAGHLQLLREDFQNEEFFVIEAGTIVAISARTEARFVNRLTIANGGAAQGITYVQQDVDAPVEDPNNPGDPLGSTGLVAAAIPANYPIGFAPYPYYQGILDETRINYELQPFVAVWNQGYLEYPITKATQAAGADALVRGALVRPGPSGELLYWDNSVQDDVTQIVGRVWTIRTIADEIPKRGLDKVHVPPGIGLSGNDSGGIPGHLNQAYDGGGNATLLFRVVIDAAV